MWIVYVNGRACCCLVRGKVYTVGRGDCDIILTGDASISRKHLTLHIEEEEENEKTEQTETTKKKKKEHTQDNDNDNDHIERLCVIITDTSTHGTEVCASSSTNINNNNNINSRSRSSSTSSDSDNSTMSSDNSVSNHMDNPADAATRTLQICNHRNNKKKNKNNNKNSNVLRCQLTRGKSFRTPRRNNAWQSFTIHIGSSHTHNNNTNNNNNNNNNKNNDNVPLQLRWIPLRIFALGVVQPQNTQLQSYAHSCGVSIVTDFTHANCLVTSQLTPTAVGIAMLCRTAHIVTPAYIEALINININNNNNSNNNNSNSANNNDNNSNSDNDNKSDIAVLLDPQAYAPPLDPFWATLWEEDLNPNPNNNNNNNNNNTDILREKEIQQRLLFPPNRNNRRTLFAGYTFVVLQRSLYAEVCNFLPYTQAQVLLDVSLHDTNGETERDAQQQQQQQQYQYQQLQSFADRHSNHVVLFNRRERLPFRHCVRVLRETLKLRCVEYLQLVRSIVCIMPLVRESEPLLKHSTSTAVKVEEVEIRKGEETEEEEKKDVSSPKRVEKEKEIEIVEQQQQQEVEEEVREIKQEKLCRSSKAAGMTVGVKRVRTGNSPSGRRTDPNPLFRETHSDTETEQHQQKQQKQKQQKYNGCEKNDERWDGQIANGEEENMAGWITREHTDVDSSNVDNNTTTTTGSTTIGDLIISGPPTLPSYPCFQPYNTLSSSSYPVNTTTTTIHNTINTTLGGKCFRKQQLTVCSETVEMDNAAETTGNGIRNSVLATTRAIDADDIIPDTSGVTETTRLSASRFNVFDATAQHHHNQQQQRQNRTTKTRRRGATRTTTTATTTATTRRMGREEEEEENVDVVPLHVGTRKKTGNGPVNIFDMEALF